MQFAVASVQCAVCSVQSVDFSIQCAIYSVLCIMFLQRALHSMHYIVCSGPRVVFNMYNTDSVCM